MECGYGAQSAIHFGDVIITSCSGVQQGDPLGPSGFSLALQPLVESVKAEVPDLNINVWYLNDGTLCGKPADLAAALEIIERCDPSRGLFRTDPSHFSTFRGQAPLAPTRYHLTFPSLEMGLFFWDALLVLGLSANLCSREEL